MKPDNDSASRTWDDNYGDSIRFGDIIKDGDCESDDDVRINPPSRGSGVIPLKGYEGVAHLQRPGVHHAL